MAPDSQIIRFFKISFQFFCYPRSNNNKKKKHTQNLHTDNLVLIPEARCNGVPVCHRNICKVMRGM